MKRNSEQQQISESVKKERQSSLVVEDLLTKSDAELSYLLSKGTLEVRKLRNFAISQVLGDSKPLRLSNLKNAPQEYIKSEIPELDRLLEGGLCCGSIIEMCGSGKTLLCMLMTCNIAKSQKRKVLYIDTNNSLEPRLFLQIFESCSKHDVETSWQALDRVEIITAFEVSSLLKVLDDLYEKHSTESQSLIVIDSIYNIISLLIGKKKGTTGNGVAALIVQMLRNISVKHNCPIIMTNNLTQQDDDGSAKPSLGEWWTYIPHTRLKLLQIAQNEIECSILSSIHLKPGGTKIKLKFFE